MTPSDCVFCKIVTRQLPSVVVLDEPDVLAFMDIGPIVKGHTLVIPKTHFEDIFDIPQGMLSQLIITVQRIAKAQLNGLKADGVNIVQANRKAAGQVVPHFHIHVIPRFLTDGHHWNWAAKKYDSTTEMEEWAERIRKGLA